MAGKWIQVPTHWLTDVFDSQKYLPWFSCTTMESYCSIVCILSYLSSPCVFHTIGHLKLNSLYVCNWNKPRSPLTIYETDLYRTQSDTWVNIQIYCYLRCLRIQDLTVLDTVGCLKCHFVLLFSQRHPGPKFICLSLRLSHTTKEWYSYLKHKFSSMLDTLG